MEGITSKSQEKVDQIKELLRKEELWQAEIAERLKISPQMVQYYLNKYLKDKYIVTKIEGHNQKLKLK